MAKEEQKEDEEADTPSCWGWQRRGNTDPAPKRGLGVSRHVRKAKAGAVAETNRVLGQGALFRVCR